MVLGSGVAIAAVTFGTDRADFLVGTKEGDVLHDRAGDDSMDGSGGDDVPYCSPGIDEDQKAWKSFRGQMHWRREELRRRDEHPTLVRGRALTAGLTVHRHTMMGGSEGEIESRIRDLYEDTVAILVYQARKAKASEGETR